MMCLLMTPALDIVNSVAAWQKPHTTEVQRGSVQLPVQEDTV